MIDPTGHNAESIYSTVQIDGYTEDGIPIIDSWGAGVLQISVDYLTENFGENIKGISELLEYRAVVKGYETLDIRNQKNENGKSIWGDINDQDLISFNGILMTPEDFGNFAYGYYSKAMGLGEFIQDLGGRLNATKKAFRRASYIYAHAYIESDGDEYFAHSEAKSEFWQMQADETLDEEWTKKGLEYYNELQNK